MNGTKRLKANREDVKSINLSIVLQYFSFLKYSALKYPYEFIFIKFTLISFWNRSRRHDEPGVCLNGSDSLFSLAVAIQYNTTAPR